MIRPTTPADTEALVALTEGTGVFKSRDVETLREVLADYFAENQAQGHRAVTSESDGQVLGYAYYAPAAMTDRTWHLWWIAVSKEVQSKGIGRELMAYLEEDIRAQHGRLLVIETSGMAAYEPTRRFYLRQGYEQEAVVRDFYADGDDIVYFRKRL